MKKITLVFLLLVSSIYAQEETKKDSINFLDEVIVQAVRVNSDSPVTHSNLSKKEIYKRNLGQDIPILMNYMPNVVTSSDAGAGVGRTSLQVGLCARNPGKGGRSFPLQS